MKRLTNSFRFAFQGFRAAVSGQPNLRFHLILSLVVIVAGFAFRVSAIEWCMLLVCIGLVVSLELTNTAIEKLVDMVSPKWSDKAGRIKDIAAAAVLVVSLIALVVGIVIFGRYFF